MTRSSLLARLGSLLTLSVVNACGGARLTGETALRKDDGDIRVRVATFQGVEDELLRDLAAVDRRVALRAHIEPREEDLRRVAMGAVLAEDASLAAVDGAIDPFSFEARARGLACVKQRLAAAPADGGAVGADSAPSPAFERELLARLVDEELVRLDEERALPRSASALVRGVVETWSPPAFPQQAAERDRWLTRRLAEIGASVTSPAAHKGASAPLDVGRARELDDALDALERAIEAAGLGHATAELVKLREALEAQGSRPAAGVASEWNEVARGVRAHLGFALEPEILDRRLASIQMALRAAVDAAIAKAPSTDVVVAQASLLVFAGGPCASAIAGSRVRSIAPPPERAAACRLRQTVASANDDTKRAAALVAMHDHVIVARWALDVARGTATIAQTTGRHRPLSRPGPDVAARWERIALARPTMALGGGLAAGILYGAGDVEERALAWAALGDVPLDIAERELGIGK